jgi:hypothetical protein
MALSLRKLQRLQSAGFVDLYAEHEQLWRQKAEQAFGYTHEFVAPTGNPVRQDDVLPLLKPVLEVSDEVRGFLADKKLSQQFWFEWFGQYIVDRLWPELIGG